MDLKFINDLTIHDYNKDNKAMRNEFIDNCVGTMMFILPRICLPLFGLKIIRGYEPIVKGNILNGYDRKFGYGLAIGVSWEDWSVDESMLIASNILRTLNELVHIVIDVDMSTLFVYRKMKDKKLILRSNKKNKILESL